MTVIRSVSYTHLDVYKRQVLYLGFLYAFFSGIVASGIILSVALLNGIIEAVVAALLCPPIVRALKKAVPALGKAASAKQTQAE